MWKYFRGLLGKQAALDVNSAIELFKAEPSKYFTYRGEPFVWPPSDTASRRPIFLDDMRVLVGTHTLGFVERVQCNRGTAQIKHIAVEKSLSGKKTGLGVVIARAYAAELRSRYGVKRILFAEDHSKYHDVGYPLFFARLGAIAMPVGPGQRTDRPDFEWLEKNWGI